jgi:hypothetical protein
LNAKPIIVFDNERNLVKFEGIFMALSSWDNKGEIITRVQDFLKNKTQVTVEYNLIYVDSVSRKLFFEIFNLLKSAIENDNKKIDVLWKYDPEDDTIYELGRVLHEVVDQPVNFIEMPD